MGLCYIKLKFLPVLLFLAGMGCTDFFRDEFVAGQDDPERQLVITAILDTDSGRFTLSMSELLLFGDDLCQQEASRNGTVVLYEDGREVLRLGGPFIFPADSADPGIYRTALTGVSAHAGCTYRLTIGLEGYPQVASTAVMPDAPVCSHSVPDLSVRTEKTGVVQINSLEAAFYTNINPAEYVAIPLSFTDRHVAANHYSLRLIRCLRTETAHGELCMETSECMPLYAGTDNHGLVAENPDLESKQTLLYVDGYEVLSFDQMVFTDCSFSGTSLSVDLLVQATDLDGYPLQNGEQQALPVHNPAAGEPVVRMTDHTDLLVQAITAETFAHYRHLALQQSGIRMLSEPVQVEGNMEGGYGCFALQNTKRMRVIELIMKNEK